MAEDVRVAMARGGIWASSPRPDRHWIGGPLGVDALAVVGSAARDAITSTAGSP